MEPSLYSELNLMSQGGRGVQKISKEMRAFKKMASGKKTGL
ncbi:hypothetical protein [Pseudomonas sp.]|nr:hypothetical protein [Pseudomonas sp.]